MADIEERGSAPVMSAEEAKKVLQQEQTEREQNCLREINAVLDKYGFTFQVSMLISPAGNVPQVQLVPKA